MRKIVSFIVFVTFLFTNTTYSMPSTDILRIPLSSSNEKGRARSEDLNRLLKLAGNPEGGILGLEKPDLTTNGMLVIDIMWFEYPEVKEMLEIMFGILDKFAESGKYTGEIFIADYLHGEEVSFRGDKKHIKDLANRYNFISFIESAAEAQKLLNYEERTDLPVLIAKHQPAFFTLDHYLDINFKKEARGDQYSERSIELSTIYLLDPFGLFRKFIEMQNTPVPLDWYEGLNDNDFRVVRDTSDGSIRNVPKGDFPVGAVLTILRQRVVQEEITTGL